jgi:transcriptional regulator with XRE-family HTH domain
VLTPRPAGGMIRFVGEDQRTAETVGVRLRRLRLERGFSQRDLSSPGVSYAYISRIEAGARRPSVKALRMLAKKLGVTPGYLETGSDLGDSEARELRLADVELRLRLDGEIDADELQSILDDAVEHADLGAATRARIAIGVHAAARGDHAVTIEALEQAVDSELLTAASRPDVFLTLGYSYATAGRPGRAVELFERGLRELAEHAPDDLATKIRFSTYLSYALTDLGELQRAKAVVSEVAASSNEITDPYTRVRLLWSLGRIALEQAKPQLALENFRRAVALLEATEDTLHLARAHVACADAAITDGNETDNAIRHLAQAERLLGARAEVDDLAVVRRMQAMCATQQGEFETAEKLGREALALASDQPNEHGQAWWAIAEARAGAGDPDADEAFEKAVELLHVHGTVRHYTNVLRAYGRYLREADRERDALNVFERAANVASNLQGEPSTAEREL